MFSGFWQLIYLGIPILLMGIFVQDDPYKWEREQMVSRQIAARGVHNKAVLEAMRKVPRHLFVPDAYDDLAYDDRPLPIGAGQTISQPYIVAYMTELIRPEPTYKVLEIGTGSGYQAAVLSEIVDQVYTIELIETLATRAEKLLQELNYDNIKVKCGDGYEGWEEFAPFDAILVTAAAESIPPPLIEQLKEGGIMVIPIGDQTYHQELKVVQKRRNRIVSRNVAPVRFVPFIHKEK